MPAVAVAAAGYALRNPRRTGRWVAIALILLGLWYLLLISIYGSIFGLRPLQGGYGPSRLATAEIPSAYLQLYQQAGERYGIDPWILAAIGSIETNHGTSTQPGVQSGVNFAGCCAGPMQFSIIGSPSTWDSYGVDGNHDGKRSPYDPEDAIPAAARYLRASGAPGDYRRALFAYNHADWYVTDVLAKAAAYRGAARAGATTAEPILSAGDSLAVGTSDPLAQLRPTVTTDAAIGRTSTQGLAELRSASSLPATLLVQLGTNDTNVREFRANVRAIKALPGVQDVYWINIARPPLAGTTDTALNAVLEAEAGPHFHVIDWKAEVTSGRAELAPDRIHATTDGYKARARLIDQALPLVGGAGDITPAGVTEILDNPRIILTTGQRADIARPGIDPRLLATLNWIGAHHTATITALRDDHYPGTNHEAGRAMDIGAVDGEICRGTTTGHCATLVHELAAITGPNRSTELIYCWDPDPSDPNMFARADHCDHIHVGWDA